MRRFLATVLLLLSGCGWQAAGSSNPSVVNTTITVSVGETTIVALPPLPLGQLRAATSSAVAVASVKIDPHGDLDITGVSGGSATVIQTDSSGAVAVTTRIYQVRVTP